MSPIPLPLVLPSLEAPVYSPYHQEYEEPPGLPCKLCQGRPAPDVELFGKWRSLILCDVCQGKQEREDWQARLAREKSVERLTDRAIQAGLTSRQIKIKTALKVRDWTRASAEDPLPYCGALFWGRDWEASRAQLVQLVKWAVWQGWSAAYLTEGALLESLRPSGRTAGRSLASFNRYSLICLDGLGSGKVSEWSRAQIFALVDQRYSAGAPLAVSSSHDLEALERLYGQGLRGRLEAMCGPRRICRMD
ncbi:MAG: hypothetical protein CMJ75_22845 [Planctomycetaceae bacterium]|nr:hypothetical protein [Planctomycetaceae bacterium]